MTALVQELQFLQTVVIFLLLVNGGLSWMLWFRGRVMLPKERTK